MKALPEPLLFVGQRGAVRSSTTARHRTRARAQGRKGRVNDTSIDEMYSDEGVAR